MCARSIFKQKQSRAVRFAEFPCDIQAETGTGCARREKRLENAISFGFVDALAVIDDMQTQTVLTGILFNVDPHRSGRLARVAQGVVQQIGNHAVEVAAIEPDLYLYRNIERDSLCISGILQRTLINEPQKIVAQLDRLRINSVPPAQFDDFRNQMVQAL